MAVLRPSERFSDPTETGAAAALRAARRAARAAPGYRVYLESAGVRLASVGRLEEVPYTDKRVVFLGEVDAWLDGGRLDAAAEVLTSSGQGGMFSVGVTSPQEIEEQEHAVDATLRAVGAGPDTSTLVVNCLPMGIGLATRLATVATPSVHLEMALAILTRLGPSYDRTVIAAEPLFLKELAEAGAERHGPGFASHVAACFVGGEFVAESLREYLTDRLGLLGPPHGAGIMISMGAAEVGLHAFVETPALRAARGALNAPEARQRLFGADAGYTPSLFVHDPRRLYVEERDHLDGERTLVVTTLRQRLLPLVRYDLGDLGEIVAPEALNRALAGTGSPLRLTEPVVAVWGRQGGEVRGARWSVRPEAVKERLFAHPEHPAALTGRFVLGERAGAPLLQAQLRPGVEATPPLRRFVEEALGGAAGTDGQVALHSARAFPFHEASDFQHKARYVVPPRPAMATAPTPTLGREAVVRSALAASPGVAVTLSDRPEDVDGALALIHDRFVEAGYQVPRASGRRFVAPYLNEGTVFAIARHGSRIVGAAALVPDGPFGLPSDRAFAEEVDDLRAEAAEPVREVGSLAIRAGVGGGAAVYAHMMAALVRLTLEECPDAPVLLSVSPGAARLYGGLLGVSPMAEPRPLFGAPAVLLRTTAPAALRAAEAGSSSRHSTLRALLGEPNPRWLRDRRAGRHWPREWLRPLLDESGLLARLRAQSALAGECEELLAGRLAGVTGGGG